MKKHRRTRCGLCGKRRLVCFHVMNDWGGRTQLEPFSFTHAAGHGPLFAGWACRACSRERGWLWVRAS